MRIYTRTGDDGSTGRLYGGRVAKTDPLMDTSGDLDEVVALLGVARAAVPAAASVTRAAHADQDQLAEIILRLQRELFVVGADLAVNPERRHKLEPGVSLVTEEMVAGLESLIDELVAERPLRPVFVVPGATPLGAALDHARAVARRAERHALAAREAGGQVSTAVGHYLNRLSDLLFVLARHAAGETDEPTTR
ncbi:cob(I)yrinic acid a,c-diamide adenosyltransferase [Ruania halotolerans]|uniref:cob(I)yrinic acid a,c-diamide adenosyltransferase n=1 Tax=Ruania halotolerans TaxID=2897773 RepID=UPI001E36F6D8|nr:cob(I)yrinic acid a,c-diamide adenosyltransferase [Ruania halotolerans]UFU07707.1 cob(I)yrinic acid a,c-diamide adenosyltransferase [Ruania halotolerans]